MMTLLYAVTVLQATPVGLSPYALVVAYPNHVMVLGKNQSPVTPATPAEQLEFRSRVSAALALAYPERRVLS
ncbi:hypothetical protein [Deinococcus radiophilus]|uniref:Uncharacterized protein n=2 Tax=Deinococcus radiophilus TaxID=32062 RepID=A0A431W0K3_9DEIO|nr:hypothetical protein [Deinococcus radiophilus]RTR29041.1 hypothetical protein EJ104_04140 [Deinococcus radiophilus]